MIATIKGTLEVRAPARVVIATAGVGYEIFVPLSTFYRLPARGDAVALEIRQVVREDAITLYGFSTATEKRALMMRCAVVSGATPPAVPEAAAAAAEPTEKVLLARKELA